MPAPPRVASKLTPSAPGQPVARFALIKACMARYLSPILVDSVLGKAMQSRGVEPSAAPTASSLDAIVEESMIGLRLFVDPERLPGLMIELAEILEGEDA